MKLLITLFTFFTYSAFATEGMIVVLEAPIFGEPDETSKVIQYYRKGQPIFLHEQEAYEDPYIDQEFNNLDVIQADNYPDPLLEDSKIYKANSSSKFYKTLAKSGREAYILKEHVRIIYKDKRELNQPKVGFDHTDYRIEEPLPKGYPLISSEDFRGQFNFGLGQPNYSPYPYKETIIDSAPSLSKETTLIWSLAKDLDNKRRFFFGAKADLHFSDIEYLLTSQKARQNNFRITVGPYASYDAYRTREFALNLYTSVQYMLIDQVDIKITDGQTGESEERQYSSTLGFSGNLGTDFIIFDVYKNFDIVVGANMRLLSPRTYSARSKGENSDLWQRTGTDDQFNQEFATELNYFVGVQSMY